jgi:dihydroxyacetone kinase
MASELAQEQGVKTERVKVWDDVASAPPDKVQERGGLAADLFVIKVAGARAENGGTIEEVVKSAETAGDNCITYAVALSPATVPSSAKPTFTIGEDEMFFGIGAHGEKGVSKTRLLPANDTAKMLVDPVVKDFLQVWRSSEPDR